MGEELLRLKNIRKSFNSVTVLEDINITLSKGEVIALVGENGAGKKHIVKYNFWSFETRWRADLF